MRSPLCGICFFFSPFCSGFELKIGVGSVFMGLGYGFARGTSNRAGHLGLQFLLRPSAKTASWQKRSYYSCSCVRFQVINHNNYNFLKCDWRINCCILRKLICKVVIQQCNRTVGCNRTIPGPIILSLSSKTTNHNIDYNHYSDQFKRLTL